MSTQKIRALIIEDSEDDFKLILRELKKENREVDYKLIDNEADLEIALKEEWDLIISDYAMPGFTGFEALNICNKKKIDIPFIMVSGTVGEDIAVDMMKSGAKDYIMKNNLKKLMPAIEREIAEAKIRIEKKQAEKSLLASERRLKFITDNAPVFIAQCDNNLRYKFVNKQYADMFNLLPSDIVGKHLREVLGEEVFYKSSPYMEAALSGLPISFDLEIYVSPGGPKFVQANYVPERDASGRTVGFIAAIVDITERKKMINQLIEAKNKAEEMSRLKSSFLANMSHELRTPLNGILGFSDIIMENEDITEIKKMSDIIHGAAVRLHNTLSQILELSILEAKTAQVEYSMFDVVGVLKESIDLLKNESELKNLKLTFDSQIDSLLSFSDRKIIFNSINSLIKNAITFTEKGSIDIKINEEIIDEVEFVAINVIDTGIGIDEINHEIIFNEFRQASEGWGRSYEGTGLGLSICRKYVELLGGTVNVSSELDAGSDFKLIFPKNKIDSNKIFFQSDKNPKNLSRDIPVEELTHKKHKILYIEDEIESAKLVKIILQKDYIIDICITGEEGLSKANQNE